MYRDWNPRLLYKCQGHLLQSEALPMLSSSSRKDESMPFFPSRSGCKFWLQRQLCEVVWHVQMARATCHFVNIQISTQTRSHRFPVSNVVGPLQIASAVRLQWQNSSNHVPRVISTWQAAEDIFQTTSFKIAEWKAFNALALKGFAPRFPPVGRWKK